MQRQLYEKAIKVLISGKARGLKKKKKGVNKTLEIETGRYLRLSGIVWIEEIKGNSRNQS